MAKEQTIDIFVGNLPAQTSVLDLRKLFALKQPARYRIMHRRDSNGHVCCYAHAVIPAQQFAHTLIARLDGSEYHGCRLAVRPLRFRSDFNERRIRRVFTASWNGVNRRRRERRQVMR